MSKRIAIIGGGYLGANLAKALEDKADVTLIEPRSHFAHSIAMIRAVVDPAILDRALIPYDKLLKRGTVLQSRATRVDAKGVTLEGGGRVDADYVIVATGSDNATPFKPKGSDIAGFRADNADVHARLNAAKTIAIVGAGAVGVELAGEIAHAMPDKTVTLVSSDPSLFPGVPGRLGSSLEQKLKAAGVDLILGARARNLENLTEPYAGTLELSDGRSVSADLIFPAIGSRGVSDLLQALPGARMGSANRIIVDKWMRPSSLGNVFAAGDMAEAGDAMTAVAAGRQVAWLKKTLATLIKGGKLDALKPYKPWTTPPILIPLGPETGTAFLSLFTAGDFLTRHMKGKDVFLEKYAKILGQA